MYEEMTRLVGRGELCTVSNLLLAGLWTVYHSGLLSKLGCCSLDILATR